MNGWMDGWMDGWTGYVLKLKYHQFCSTQSWRMCESACDRVKKSKLT